MIKVQIGQRYGRLTVKSKAPSDKKHGFWWCKCDCNIEDNPNLYVKVRTDSLTSGRTKSCGCLLKESAAKNGKSCAIDLTGQTYGFLTALKPTNQRSGGNIIWKCICNRCNTVTYVSTSEWGKTQSCGCLKHINLKNQRFGKLVAKQMLDEVDSTGYNYWKCDCDCGGTLITTSHTLVNNRVHSCGCSNSNGELKLSHILTDLNINFIKQKVFDDCINDKTNKKLLFDFYLPDYSCCIEYDGEQHYKDKAFFRDSLEDRQYRDNIKTEYCLNNQINLIRISYLDYDKLNNDYLIQRLKEVM